jgi:CRP-like cAMP-binding protein
MQIKAAWPFRNNYLKMVAPTIRAQDFLRTLPLFNGVGADALDRLAAGTMHARAPAGTVLFRRGEPCSTFYVIIQGQVKLAFGGRDGAEKVVEILGPGQAFGEPLMFLDEPHVGFAETLAESQLFLLGRAALLSEIDRNPCLARNMLARLAQQLHYLITDIESYTLKSSAERVIAYLLREVPTESRAPLEVRLPVAKGVVASRLSITREHFSRVLHELAQAGLIDLAGRTIRISDPARLRAWHGRGEKTEFA